MNELLEKAAQSIVNGIVNELCEPKCAKCGHNFDIIKGLHGHVLIESVLKTRREVLDLCPCCLEQVRQFIYNPECYEAGR